MENMEDVSISIRVKNSETAFNGKICAIAHETGL